MKESGQIRGAIRARDATPPSPPDYEPPHSNRGRVRSLSFIADADVSIKYTLQNRINGRLNIIKKKPLLLLPCFLVFAAISVVGILGIVFYVQFRSDDRSDNMLNRLDDSVQQIVSGFASAAGGASAMAVYTETIVYDRHSNVSIPKRFEDGFEVASESILDRWPASTALYVDPNGVVTYVYPAPRLSNLPIGFDLFSYSEDVSFDKVLNLPIFFSGPYSNSVSGERYFHSFVPIWAPAASNETDFGYGVRENCPLCWNVTTRKRLFGTARSILSLDVLLATSTIHTLIDEGLHVTIRQRPLPPLDVNSLSENIVFSSSAGSNICEWSDDITFSKVDAFNLRWEVCAHAVRFEPYWFEYAIAGCILTAIVLSVLFLALLVERNHGSVILEEILPRDVIGHLKKGVGPYSEKYENVTILFCDIVGFTQLSSALDPSQVVNMLDDLYTKFDKLTDKHGVYKVETIGDAYMCVCGCPDRRDPSISALRTVSLARDIVKCARSFKKSYFPPGFEFRVRIGLHSGDVVAGVVGSKMPRFCLFGDTVNTASRMESSGKPMHIQVSSSTAALLRRRKRDNVILSPRSGCEHQSDLYYLSARGKISIKGKGEMRTFWISDKSRSCGGGSDHISDTASDVSTREFFDCNDSDGDPASENMMSPSVKFLATLPTLISETALNINEDEDIANLDTSASDASTTSRSRSPAAIGRSIARFLGNDAVTDGNPYEEL